MKKVRLLLADDHPEILQLLGLLLSDEYLIVGMVENGSALVTAAVELRPDIIISDIDMPILNGLEAARRLRSLLPQTAVILMSGHDEAEYVAAACAAGARAFVPKGGLRELRTVLNSVIHGLDGNIAEGFAGQPLGTFEVAPSAERGAI